MDFEELAYFWRKQDADVEVGREPPTKITGWAHYEDAQPGHMVWWRRQVNQPFRGSVLFAGDERAAVALCPTGQSAVVRHPDIRGLISKTIRRFGPRHQLQVPAATVELTETAYGVFAKTSAHVHRTAQIIEAQNYEWIDERWADFPAVGGLEIGPDVHIGAYTTIVKGALGDTRIDEGCRIGHHVNIGHDVRIGKHTIVVACSAIAGWARIGERVRIYQGAMIKNNVAVGDGAVIGMGAVVVDDVGPGEVWAGNPAKRIGYAAAGI